MANSYEEARKQRLEDNNRRFQELGVKKMASSLNDVIRHRNKTPREYQVKSKTTPPVNPDLVRRSSRPRNLIDPDLVRLWCSRPRNICKTSYVAKRVATTAQRAEALKRATSFQKGLLSGNPSFVKSMSHSQVAVNFALNVPLEICNNHLPKETKAIIVLEDEEGSLYETYYNGGSKYLCFGWRVFCTDHKLDDGDALVIELIQPTRFKIYIFKVSNDIGEASYIATRVATKAERSDALKRAESFQNRLLSGHPSFVKSMSHSHVAAQQPALRIPVEFSNNHLSKETKVSIVLEDEEGLVYETIYNGVTRYVGAGWKIFSIDHKLDDGDAVVIELIEPTRFKVHIFRVPDVSEIKVDQPKKARERKYAKAVDTEQIAKPTGRKGRNSKKAEKQKKYGGEESSSQATTEPDVEILNLGQELEIPIGDLHTAMKRTTELEAQVAAHDKLGTANGALQAALKRIAELEAQVENLAMVNNRHEAQATSSQGVSGKGERVPKKRKLQSEKEGSSKGESSKGASKKTKESSNAAPEKTAAKPDPSLKRKVVAKVVVSKSTHKSVPRQEVDSTVHEQLQNYKE